MKRKNKRMVSLLLAVCMVVATILSGCTSEREMVSLFNDKDANFIIIRSAEADSKVITIASELRQKIIDALDVSIPFKPDTVKHKEGQMEVNIGITNRPESQAIYDEIMKKNKNNGMDWAIRVNDEYIYIVGATDESLQVATDTFFANFCRDMSAQVPTDYKYLYHYENEENNFTLCGTKDLSDYSIVTPRYNMSYLVGREIEELQSELMLATGTSLEEKTDAAKEADCEIIIDHTKRSGTPKCASEDEYYIQMKGKKLYVCGGSDAATAIAVKEVTKMVKEGKAIDKKTNIKGSYEKAVKSYENYYSMTFHDEFDTYDTSVWTAQTGGFNNNSEGAGKPTSFSDAADMIYTKDGNLVMEAQNKPDQYLSSEIRTTNSVWYKYGFVEISAKLDNSKGIVPAFWLLGFSGQEYHSEIDIFECFGDPTFIKATPLAHVDGSNATEGSDVYYCGAVKNHWEETLFKLTDGESFADEYHTFGCEWNETSVKWVYDGRVFLEIDTTYDNRSMKTFNGAQQIIFSVYGGCDIADLTGYPDETTDWSKNKMVIDHIRLYQMPGQELSNK